MPSSPRNSQLPPLKKRQSLPDFVSKDQQDALKLLALKMRLHSPSTSSTPPTDSDETQLENLEINVGSGPDYTSLLSDQILCIILSKMPESQQIPNSLVCKRWEKLSGRLIHSLKLLDWEFLESGRLIYRFPNLTDVDLVRACIKSPRNSGILLSHRFVLVHLNSGVSNDGFIRKHDLLDSGLIDQGIRVLAGGCLNLRKLVLIGASEEGLTCVAEECKTLQELELHCCLDFVLKGISGCKNLQILKLIGCVDGFYDSVISDIGLTILAQGCRRLVKLELVGCKDRKSVV